MQSQIIINIESADHNEDALDALGNDIIQMLKVIKSKHKGAKIKKVKFLIHGRKNRIEIID